MSKKWLVAVLTVLVSGTAAASENWTIKNFDVAAAIQPDGSVQITETIAADFSYERAKHGIFRTIPVRYTDDHGKNFSTPLRVTGVTDADGRTRPYKITTDGDNRVIRIGDPNRTVGADEVYKISYVVQSVLQRFDDHDEFYWNVTGHDWPVEIEASTLTVTLPADSELLRTKCFTGRVGSKSENCSAAAEDGRSVKFQTETRLSARAGWTAVFGFDRELVTVAGRDYEPLITVQDVLDVVMIFLPLGLLWWILKKRQKRLSELRVDKPIIPMYDPPDGLLPAGIGTLRDNQLDAQDITAAIVSLAVRGYLKISETKSGLFGLSQDYMLTRTQKSTTDLEPFDTKLLAALFGLGTTVRFSDLRNTFYLSIQGLTTTVEEKLKNGGLFRSEKISLVFEFLGVQGLLIIGAVFTKMGGGTWVLLVYVGAFLVGNLLLMKFPSQKTVRGAQVAHEIKCYREFLMTAEADRLEWAEKQNIFEKNLPYAIALGVAGVWADRFKNLVQVPQWYDGGERMQMTNFGSRLDGLSHDFHNTAMVAPKSSGSGFSGGSSGGGGGGGGGGSW